MQKSRLLPLLLLSAFALNAQIINLRGKISNHSGKPVANAIVTLVNQNLKDTTDADGLYSIYRNSVAVSPKDLIPQLQSISVENGFLKFSLPSPAPVRVEFFDVKGKLLKREMMPNASSGFYSFNIEKSIQNKLLVIRTSIGSDEFTFRYLPLKGAFVLNKSNSNPIVSNGKFAKIKAIDDTLKITAPNYSPKVIAISAYDQDLDVILDSIQESGRSSGCGKNPTLTSGKRTIQSAGQNRSFIMRIPDNYDKNHPYRLIFAFHWNGGTSEDVDGGGTSGYTWSYYGLREQANNSTIFVAPQGIGNGWANSNGRDLTFVDDMVKLIQNDLCVDTKRLFSMGFSYGGGMSYAIACARAKVFRGVAIYSGAQLSGCEGGNDPIAYIGIHGIGDQTCRIEGGRSLRDRSVRNNTCTTQNPSEPSSGSKTHICTKYPGCKEGYPVEWCAFDGGHTPGIVDGGGDDGAKTWTKTEVWKFFSQF